MKKIFSVIAIAVFLSICLEGCSENDPVIFTDSQVEFDATTLNANAAGLTYPIIGRIPGFGRVANTTDSTLRRFSRTIRIRINLVGAQLTTQEETVGYEVFTSSPISSFSMPATITNQTPAMPAATLAVSNAVAGVHYAALSGILNFPTDSSFAFLEIPILNPGATAGAGRFLGLRLNSNGTIKPSVNFSELGLVIDQR